MAEYTNLTTLDGLAVGDVITYDTTTAIDFKGATVKVELYGQATTAKISKYTYASNGGLTSFIINTANLPNSILSFNNGKSANGNSTYAKRCDLIYGDTDDLYYRIAVAGGAGRTYTGSGSNNGIGGPGGGITGGNATSNGNINYSNYYGRGGTQTAAGRNRDSGYTAGGFGKGGQGSTHYGGYGWYGGGIGVVTTNPYSDGGGSGFIIGVSTTTYPSGYLGDDTDLQTLIASSITEGTLTQGGTKRSNTAEIPSEGSSKTTPEMILTVLELGSTASKLKYYNGTSFIDTNINYYDGSKFIPCNAYRFNGTEFIKL
jgi:hypothetical protein